MAGKLARSWALTKQSWSVLRDQPGLLVFPLVGGAVTVVLITAALGGLAAVMMANEAAHPVASNAGPWAHVSRALWYPGLFVVYLVSHLVVSFCQSALMACALKRMDGEKPTVGYGVSVAASRWRQLLGWSLVSATVGVALQMLKDQMGWLGKMVFGGAGIVWNIAAFFVVPVLVIEGLGPIAAVKRSAEVMKKTWGESLVTQFGFATVTTLIGAAAFFGIILAGVGFSLATGSPIPGAVAFLLAVASLVVLGVVQSAMRAVLIAAAYRYASTGEVSGPFDHETMQGMFKVK